MTRRDDDRPKQPGKHYGYEQAAGESGGRPVLPSHNVWVPNFGVFNSAELDALINRVGNPIAPALYLHLFAASVLKGPRKGEALVQYQTLEARLRPPKPQQGAWPRGPTRKQIRTALDHLELVGLIHRNRAQNEAQGQLRVVLSHRTGTGTA